MPRPRKLTPSYVLHPNSGQGRLIWTDNLGVRREKLLPGPFGSPESLQAKARLETEIYASPARCAGPSEPRPGFSIAELILAFHGHATNHYRDTDGKPTKELLVIRYALRPVRELYGTTPAAEFGPLKLKAVRQQMIDSGLSRALINRRVSVIKRVFKWAVSEELIPPSVFEGLRAVAGLERGRTAAREAAPVEPVDDATVDATLPFLPAHVRALVELLRHTGMRPAEACALTLTQIDRTGDVWIYKPGRHKTQHRGKGRVIPFGPKARALLEGFLTGREIAPDEPVFSPRRARAERFAALRAKRKTKVQPSQTSRKKSKPKRQPAERYNPETVSHAVKAAAAKAGVAHWHPYQLRHSFATKVRKEYGLEAAQVLLGHSRADVTQIYAEKNNALGAAVAAKIG
ncbi:MAG TPA: tyrosine-type recombinase/integrase [Gemmata sp.]